MAHHFAAAGRSRRASNRCAIASDRSILSMRKMKKKIKLSRIIGHVLFLSPPKREITILFLNRASWFLIIQLPQTETENGDSMKCRRFRLENGEGVGDRDEVYNSPTTPVLENPEYQTRWYFKYFLGKCKICLEFLMIQPNSIDFLTNIFLVGKISTSSASNLRGHRQRETAILPVGRANRFEQPRRSAVQSHPVEENGKFLNISGIYYTYKKSHFLFDLFILILIVIGANVVESFLLDLSSIALSLSRHLLCVSV